MLYVNVWRNFPKWFDSNNIQTLECAIEGENRLSLLPSPYLILLGNWCTSQFYIVHNTCHYTNISANWGSINELNYAQDQIYVNLYVILIKFVEGQFHVSYGCC
jgi:hypothetical protein